MGRIDALKGGDSSYEKVREVDVVATCRLCWHQAEKVFYDREKHLLFWVCPNGHEEFVEEFDYIG